MRETSRRTRHPGTGRPLLGREADASRDSASASPGMVKRSRVTRRLRVIRRGASVPAVDIALHADPGGLSRVARPTEGGLRPVLLVDGEPTARTAGAGDRTLRHDRRRTTCGVRVEPFVMAGYPRAGRTVGRLFRLQGRGWDVGRSSPPSPALGRTVFVSRQRGATGRERDVMRARLAAGDNLLLFPEGTILGWLARAAVPVVVLRNRRGRRPAADPAGVGSLRPVGRPAHRPGHRPVFAWYGDMDLGIAFLALRPATRAAGQRSCCIPRSIRRDLPAARPCRTTSGRRWLKGQQSCGKTGRSRSRNNMQAPAWNLCIVELPVDRVAGIPATLPECPRRRIRAVALDPVDQPDDPVCPRAGLVRQGRAERGR